MKPAMSSDCCVSNNLFPIGNWNEESVAEEEAKSIHDDSMILIVDHGEGDDAKDQVATHHPDPEPNVNVHVWEQVAS